MTNKDQKITILIDSLRGGGAERVCTTVASGLADRGWEVNLLILNLKEEAYMKYLSPKVKVVNLRTKQAYSFLKIYKYLRKNNLSKILVFNHQLTVISVILKKIFNLNIKIFSRNINTLSEIIALDYQRKPFKKWLVNKYYKQADIFVNQCIAMEQDLLRLHPELRGKTSVIYNPVAKYIEDYVTNSNILIEKDNYFLCIGRLSEQKALHFAIDAFAKLAGDVEDIRLKIVGQGDVEKDLKQKVDELGLVERVDFEGFRKNIIPYYLKAKATLLTSLFEGFPNVLIESITLGTPVVAFDCPSGPCEIIKNGVNGFLVDNQNTEMFANKMKKVMLMNFDILDMKDSIKYTSNHDVIGQWSNLLGK